MPIPRFSLFWLCVGVISALVLSYFFYCCKCKFELWALTPTQRVINAKLAREGESFKTLQYDLIGPNQAPDSLKDLVIQGYNIMVHTQEYAHDYVGDLLFLYKLPLRCGHIDRRQRRRDLAGRRLGFVSPVQRQIQTCHHFARPH